MVVGKKMLLANLELPNAELIRSLKNLKKPILTGCIIVRAYYIFMTS
jgi:hypothetical protein